MIGSPQALPPATGDNGAEVSLLVEHPEFIPALVEGLLATWGEEKTPPRTRTRIEKLEAHCSRRELPIALVAHDDTGPLGIVCVRRSDLIGYERLGPWLGGLFVFPEARRRGLASRLCVAAESLARTLETRELYLVTPHVGALYKRLGWRWYEDATWQGDPVTIYRQDLSVARETPATDSESSFPRKVPG